MATQKFTLLNVLVRLPHCILFILSAGVLAAQDSVASPGPSANEIVRRSLERDHLNFERARDYTFIQRTERRQLDASGRFKKVESSTHDILMMGGRPYQRKIAENDKPLSVEEARKVEAQFEKALRERRGESQEEKRKKSAEAEKSRAEARAFVDEIPDAFMFRLLGEESIDGHPVWAIEAEPRPGFKARAKRAELLAKIRGRLWIDQNEYQWVKVEAETIAPISFGWILARLGAGGRLTFEQTRVSSEVWLPARATAKFHARLAVLKRLSAEMEVTWGEYRKFRTDSRIISTEEIRPEQ